MRERAKNEMRVRDILRKAAGDRDKAMRLAATQAKLIKDPDKTWNRGTVAEEMGEKDIADIFFHQYKRLTQTRDDKLSIILEAFFAEEESNTTT